MQIHAMLETRKKEITAEIEKLQAELSEINRMMGNASRKTSLSSSSVPTLPVPASKDDAMLQAIKAGFTTPKTIGDYMREKLGMTVNDASTRTRLSRMKGANKIALDGNGWKLID